MKIRKYIRVNVIASILALAFSSCKNEPLMTYHTTDNAYFDQRSNISATVPQGLLTDSSLFTFAYADPSATDTLMPIRISVTGSPSSADRLLSITVDPSSTAVEGIHYELPLSFVMHAGKVTDSIYIRLKKDASLQQGDVYLRMNLRPNEYFSNDIKYRVASGSDTLQTLSFKLTTSGILAPGPAWGTPYFGTFSTKKVQLMYEVVGMPLTLWAPKQYQGDIDSSVMFSLATYYATKMSRYLQDQAAAGHVVYDEDGTPMQMGTSFQ